MIREYNLQMSHEQTLSNITKKLYSYVLTVDVEDGTYSLFQGTGLQEMVDILASTNDFETVREKIGATIHPNYYDRVMNIINIPYFIKNADNDDFIGSIEFPMDYEDGTFKWNEVNLFTSRTEDGKQIVNIVGRDITASTRVMRQQEREQRAAAARDNLLSGITKILYGYAISVNLNTMKYTMIDNSGIKEAANFFSYTDDYAISFSRLKKYIHKDDLDEMEKFSSPEALEALIGKDGYIGVKAYSAWVCGKIQRHEVYIFVGTDEEGEPIATLLDRDVTESYRAQIRREEELRAESVRDQVLSEITKKLYSYNITVNLATREFDIIEGAGMEHIKNVLYAFPKYEDAIETLLTYVAPEHKQAFADTVRFDAVYQRRHEEGLIQTLEYASLAGGKREWHEIHVFMGTNEVGEPIVNFLGRDITTAHDRAEALAQLEIEKEANAAKSMFLSNMSHDIRTPMNGIMGMLARARKHINDRDILTDSLDKIQVSSNHLLSLINDVLDISRLEAGKMDFAQEAFSFNMLLDTCCSITQGQLVGSNITFVKDFSQISHEYVVGSELHIRQILLNILGNAVKYTTDGEIHFIVNEIAADEEKVRYRFVVKDTGIGMSEEFLKHIFDAFSQENINSARSKYAGTGLGMSIVKKMVNAMDGTIAVESVLGEGSTFTVELELPITTKEQLKRPEEIVDDAINTSGMKVLLVEDNELNMEFEKEILLDAGCIVSEAVNGKEALDMFINSAPGTYDMILMDVMMPVMNGLDASKEIRRSGHPEAKTIPIIAQTANAFAEDIQAAKLAGMNDHVSKPIDTDKLFHVMGKYRKDSY